MSIIRTIPYAVLSAGLLAAGGASAQSMGSIDAREANQQERIEQGRADGQLTRGETRRLEQGEQRIDRYEARARADGVVTPQERQRLDGMLNRESHDIYQQSHDNQRADDRGWGRDGRDGWGHDRDADGRDGGDGGFDHRDGTAAAIAMAATTANRVGDRDNGRYGGNRDHRDGRDGSHTRLEHAARQRHAQLGQQRLASAAGRRHDADHAGSGTQANNGTHNWGNGGWHQPQAGGTTPTTPASGTQPEQRYAQLGQWRLAHSRRRRAARRRPARSPAPLRIAGAASDAAGERHRRQRRPLPRPTFTRTASSGDVAVVAGAATARLNRS